MWKCPKCERIFEKVKQMHSCKLVPLEAHFINKERAKVLFDSLVERINNDVGTSQIVSLPCCVHLFGIYDFLAALPKKDSLEIRFCLNRALESPKLIQAIPISSNTFKNCIELSKIEEIDTELIGWIREAYSLKGRL